MKSYTYCLVVGLLMALAPDYVMAQGYHLRTLTPTSVQIGSDAYVYAEARNDGSALWPYPQAWALKCVNSWSPGWTNWYWQDNGWASQGQTTTLYKTISASLLPVQTGTYTIATTAYYKRMDSIYAFMNNTPIETTITMTPAPPNQAPTNILVSATSVAENMASGTTVGTLSTQDPDVGNTFTYTLVAGSGSADNASFTISGSSLKTAASFNYEVKNSYSVRVRTTDQGGLWYEKIFTITVSNVNETPTNSALSNSTVPENQPSGTTVGTLSTTDPDVGNTFTYTLVAGSGSADNASFTISGSSLKTAASFNYEVKNSYSVRVRTTDQGNLWYEKVFTITVSNVNDAPTDILLSGTNVTENLPSGTVIGGFRTQDQDAANTFTYTLVAGVGSTDNGSFTISGTNLLTAAIFDYETQHTYSIRVQSADQGGGATQKVFAINVLKEQALVVTPALSSCSFDGTGDYLWMSSDQVLSNGSFEVWSAGDSAAPDSWLLAGTGASIARETGTIKIGNNAVKVTRGSSLVQFYQRVDLAKGVAYWKGRTVTFGAWVNTAVAGSVRIVVYDGTASSISATHTGDSTWQYLTVSGTIDASATQVGAYVQVLSDGAVAYIDGAFLSDDAASSFNFGTEPFTIDLWIHPTAAAGAAEQRILSQQTGANYWVLQLTTGGKLQWVESGAVVNMIGTTVLSNATWQHVEVVRDGTSITLRLNGAEEASRTIAESARIAEDSGIVQIGAWSGTRFFTGYLDEVRVSKGIARHTADFVPLRVRHAADVYTKLLLHFDGEQGSPDIMDSSDVARPVWATGNAAISEVQYGPLYLPVREGCSNSNVTVRLATQPGGNVTVVANRTSGDADMNVTSGASLTFTVANWNVPQAVTLSAGEDADYVNGTAIFTISSSGLTSQTVPAMELDNDMEMLAFERGAGNTAIIRWSSLTNCLYILHHATDLKTGFSVLQAEIPSTPPVNTYTDNLNGVNMKFWAVSMEE